MSLHNYVVTDIKKVSTKNFQLFPHSFPQALCKLNLAELFDFLWEVLSLNRKTGIRILAIAIAVVLALSLLPHLKRAIESHKYENIK